MNDILRIGNINFSDIINENEITKAKSRFRPKKIGECKVEVYGPDEGQIPHFHIFNIDKSFNCCIRIYDNHFFSHGNVYRDTLNTAQCKELHKWLMQINDKAIVPTTNWQSIVFAWDLANPDCLYPDSKKYNEQPRYDIMNSFRDSV